MSDEARGEEQPEAQRVDGDFGLPAEVALEQHGKVVGSRAGVRVGGAEQECAGARFVGFNWKPRRN